MGPNAYGRISCVALVPHETPQTAHSFKNPLDVVLDGTLMIKLAFPKHMHMTSSMMIKFEVSLKNVAHTILFFKIHHAHYHNVYK